MPEKLGRMVTYFGRLLFVKLHDLMWQTKTIIYPPSQCTTKLCTVGIPSEELLFIMSEGPLTTWSCKATWIIRSVISLQPQGLYQFFIHSPYVYRIHQTYNSWSMWGQFELELVKSSLPLPKIHYMYFKMMKLGTVKKCI